MKTQNNRISKVNSDIYNEITLLIILSCIKMKLSS